MEHFAKRNRVLYVEQPVHPFVALKRPNDFKERWSRARSGPLEVGCNLYTMCGTFPFPYHSGLQLSASPQVNRLNQRWFAATLKKAIRTLGFRRPILWIYAPQAGPLIEMIAPSSVVLHVIDDWNAFAGMPASLAALTDTVARRADLVITVSQSLYDRYHGLNSNTHLIRHGYHDYFADTVDGADCPRDLASLPRPIFGYYGALHKLDPQLITDVARAKPDWSFVLIGPSEGLQGANLSWARKLSNVFVLGPKSQHELPSYLRQFAAAWFPFSINDLTYAMCPIKAYECMALGIPVVSTPIPEIELFGELAYTASDATATISSLKRALQESASLRTRRKLAVRDSTWSRRVQQIDALISAVARPPRQTPLS